MEKIINEAFNGMIKEYKKIFKYYYPAHGSTGLMEANQVHLFVKSLTALSDSAFSWLEPPLEKVGRSYPHIDAVVFIPNEKAAIFIEAKRINNPNKKINDIYKDIDRLLINDNREHIIKKAKAQFPIENHYIVYLADVWLENARKKSIPFWWCSEKLSNDISSSRFKDTSTFVEEMNKKGSSLETRESTNLLLQ